jgi:hypothetical protein
MTSQKLIREVETEEFIEEQLEEETELFERKDNKSKENVLID